MATAEVIELTPEVVAEIEAFLRQKVEEMTIPPEIIATVRSLEALAPSQPDEEEASQEGKG